MNAFAGTLRSEILGFVYFVRSGDRDFVKIGFATNPTSRLADLQCGNPDKLSIIRTVEGTTRDELRWHGKFKALRVHSEWFRLAPELVDAIERAEEVCEELWQAEQPEEIEMPDTWRRFIAFMKEKKSAAHQGKSTRLVPEQIPEIRAAPGSIRAIASAYGVSPMCIQQIRARKTWRHIP